MIKKGILRIVNVVIVLIGITFLSFSLLYLAPGDPAETYIRGGDGNAGTVSEEAIQAQREKWGLDKPFFVQYFNWLGNILRGNFGESYTTNRPVLEGIGSKIGPTLILSVAALFVTLLISTASRSHFSTERTTRSLVSSYPTIVAGIVFSASSKAIAMLLAPFITCWLVATYTSESSSANITPLPAPSA